MPQLLPAEEHITEFGATYRLGTRGGEPFIRCELCGLASYDAYDVERLYCERCDGWHVVREDGRNG